MAENKYHAAEIEHTWQQRWEADRLYHVSVDHTKPAHYALTMYPYPSGDLHMGHWYAMVPSDARARWMRMRGSQPVPTFGEDQLADDPGPPPAPGPLVSAFALGCQDLRRLWSEVLPPQTLLALQRIGREPPETFRMPDALWARIVYDFAVGWRMKSMDREQLLRSMTPLYLGWVAGFVNEAAPLAPPEAEARVERLCAAFESEKRYLISRWRWPDRFSP